MVPLRFIADLFLALFFGWGMFKACTHSVIGLLSLYYCDNISTNYNIY